MNIRNSVRLTLLATTMVLGAGTASNSLAATQTSTLNVTATITNVCAISTTNGVAFGAYDPVTANATTPLTATGTLSVTCTSGATEPVITLGVGNNANVAGSAAAPQRQMISAGSLLPYFLYQDAGFSVVWGNTAGSGEGYTGTGTASTLTVYGSIPAGQNVPAGSYADSVVATVTY
jgi:spore coat protein U-like protein